MTLRDRTVSRDPWAPELLFEPWRPVGRAQEGERVEAGPVEPSPRSFVPGGTPAGGAPEPPDADPAPEPLPDPAVDPVLFLRRGGIPLLESVAARLDDFGHAGHIQDLLDLIEEPSLRLLVWPRSGPMEDPDSDDRATLEIEAGVDGSNRETPAEAPVRVKLWRGRDPRRVTVLATLPARDLDPRWIERQLVMGLRQVFSAG